MKRLKGYSGTDYVIRLPHRSVAISNRYKHSTENLVNPTKWVALVVTVLLLASCSNGSDEPEDRKFANDPTVEQSPTVQDATPSVEPEATSEDVEPAESPSAILSSPGAPNTFYELDENTITSVSVRDGQTAINEWHAENDREIAGIASSPEGSQVAGIFVPSEGNAELVTYDADGNVILKVSDILDLTEMRATPVSDGTGGPIESEFYISISWSPRGDQILLGSSAEQLGKSVV